MNQAEQGASMRIARLVVMQSLVLSASLLLSAGAAHAQAASSPQKSAGPAGAPAKSAGMSRAEEAHRKDDIAKHRQMAQAHDEAARCLERGEKEAVCQERLQAACKGIAVGRYCGMRHGG
jgi:hypothetical protein